MSSKKGFLEMNLDNQKNIDNIKIIEIVESSIDELCMEYKEKSTFYFTEKDLVCKFHNIFTSKLGDYEVLGKDGARHQIFHTEYPTPFRCDMNKSTFRIVSDSERKIKDGKEGGKFKRGHYDIVILNPLVIQQLSYEEIRSQDYELFKMNVKNKISQKNSMILYGIEFMLHRGEMKPKTAIGFADKIEQDHKKLEASKDPIASEYACPGFINNFQTVVFFEDSSQQLILQDRVKNFENVRLQPAKTDNR